MKNAKRQNRYRVYICQECGFQDWTLPVMIGHLYSPYNKVCKNYTIKYFVRKLKEV